MVILLHRSRKDVQAQYNSPHNIFRLRSHDTSSSHFFDAVVAVVVVVVIVSVCYARQTNVDVNQNLSDKWPNQTTYLCQIVNIANHSNLMNRNRMK